MFFKKNQLKERKKRKVVLVTGASSGLGLAIAKQLILDDLYFVVMTSRSTSSVRFDDEFILKNKNIWIRELDIIDHSQITEVIDEINSAHGGVDILINNAGISERSTVEDSDDSGRQRQLDVNYLAPLELIAQTLPTMRKKKYGRIINISSAGGFMAMPTMSAYSASKFALEAASESLWYEMKPWGINITLIIPGFINSLGYLNTTDSINSKLSSRNSKSAYYEHYRGMRALVARSMVGTRATNQGIAFKISKVLCCKNPPLRVYITFEAQLFYWMRKLMPPGLYHYILYIFLPNIKAWGKNKYQTNNSKP